MFKKKESKNMKNLIKILSLALAVLLALSLAACGAKESNDETAKVSSSGKLKVIDIPLSEEEYAFAVQQNDEEFLKQVNEFLAEIKEDGTFDEIFNNYFGDGTPQKFKSDKLDTSKKQLVVATNAAFEPFEAVDEDENYYGIDMEIAKALGKKLGLDVVIQNMDFDAVVNSVQSGKCNIAMAALSVTPKRQEIVNFTETYYNASQIVVVNEENKDFDDCKTKEDVEKILNGYDSTTKIGCQGGTTGELYIKGDEDYGFPGLKATANAYKLAALAMTDMIQGKITCVIVDNGPAKAIVSKINANK